VEPKRVKKDSQVICLFMLLGSGCEKAACRMLMKLTLMCVCATTMFKLSCLLKRKQINVNQTLRYGLVEVKKILKYKMKLNFKVLILLSHSLNILIAADHFRVI